MEVAVQARAQGRRASLAAARRCGASSWSRRASRARGLLRGLPAAVGSGLPQQRLQRRLRPWPARLRPRPASFRGHGFRVRRPDRRLGLAKARWSSAVRSPEPRASSSSGAGPPRSLAPRARAAGRSTKLQPSAASRHQLLQHGQDGRRAPRTAAARSTPGAAACWRSRPRSGSGRPRARDGSPASSRRNSFKMATSWPKRIEVLDCSAPVRVGSRCGAGPRACLASAAVARNTNGPSSGRVRRRHQQCLEHARDDAVGFEAVDQGGRADPPRSKRAMGRSGRPLCVAPRPAPAGRT